MEPGDVAGIFAGLLLSFFTVTGQLKTVSQHSDIYMSSNV